MKVTDFILDFLSAQGVRHVFGITGGYITPLFDAFHGREDIRYICNQHEQASAMAADAYARLTGFGCAITTSGPGATNLITGIGCSYFDSIPVLFIAGQVPTGESKGMMKVRQRGFQETDIIGIVQPITKYARHVNDPKDIQYAMEAALWYATEGRPGPVLLDLPMDVLQAEIDPYTLMHFTPAFRAHVNIDVTEIIHLLEDAERPVLIYGNGARHVRDELLSFIERTKIPCLPSWAALDLVSHDHPQFVSQFGVYGSRAGNFVVQNADLVLAIGTRLDGRMTGSKGFAPKAVRVVVDIDVHEAKKTFPDKVIAATALDFLQAMNSEDLPIAGSYTWRNRIQEWKDNYPLVVPSGDKIHPLGFVSALFDALPEDAIVVTDCGGNLSWTQQGAKLNGTQRLFSAYGYSPMGYSFPAAIGAHYATGKPIVCIIGDGGMQMNIQELQTIKNYNIPIKVFIMNNHGYGIIRQFQEELFDGRYEATMEGIPDFQKVAEAYGLVSWRLLNKSMLEWMPQEVLKQPGALICDVEIDPDARIFPKCSYGNSLENQSPLLPEEELAKNMADE